MLALFVTSFRNIYLYVDILSVQQMEVVDELKCSSFQIFPQNDLLSWSWAGGKDNMEQKTQFEPIMRLGFLQVTLIPDEKKKK